MRLFGVFADGFDVFLQICEWIWWFFCKPVDGIGESADGIDGLFGESADGVGYFFEFAVGIDGF